MILGRHGILPRNFAEKLSAAATFRSFLVHIYEDIEPEIVKKFLVENLDDFGLLASYVAQYLGKFEE